MTITSKHPAPDCKYLDLASVNKVCGTSTQVMVYGDGPCQYTDVREVLAKLKVDQKPRFKKVFNWQVATINQPECGEEWRNLNVIRFQAANRKPWQFSRPCKSAITDLVLENYKHLKEGKAVIPLLFCLEIEANGKKNDPLTMEQISSKEDKFNDKITCRELRRAYKLCTHENPEVRKAAEATFRFVKLKQTSKNTYALERIQSPWADKDKADELWLKRMRASKMKEKEKSINWLLQFNEQIVAYDKVVSQPPVAFSLPSLLSKTICSSVHNALIAAAHAKEE